MRVIQNYHMDTQGWNDIAYNFAVCPHGFVFIGRDHGVRSSANGSNVGNAESEAVCFLGGIGDPFTLEGEQAYKEIMFEISGTQYCHNHWFNTMCPGPEICDEIKNGYPRLANQPPLKEREMSVPAQAFINNHKWWFVIGQDHDVYASVDNSGFFVLLERDSSGKQKSVFVDGLSAIVQEDKIVVGGKGMDAKGWQIVFTPDKQPSDAWLGLIDEHDHIIL
jgi:hypothetical protein